MRSLIELILLFLFIILFVKGCGSCSKNYHNDYGVKGWGESIIYGDNYINEKYKNKKE